MLIDKCLMKDLHTYICIKNQQTHVYLPSVKWTSKQKKSYKVVSRPNDFLSAKY